MMPTCLLEAKLDLWQLVRVCLFIAAQLKFFKMIVSIYLVRSMYLYVFAKKYGNLEASIVVGSFTWDQVLKMAHIQNCSRKIVHEDRNS